MRFRIAAAPDVVQVVALVAAVNVIVAGAALAGLAIPLLGLAIVVPLVLAVVDRPQRGLLALVALTPFNGLLVLLPLPPLAAYWKEAVVLATLAATFVAPAAARGGNDRRLPRWTPGLAVFAALGVVSAAVVGGLPGLVGLKITLFAVLVLVAVWRCPFDAGERDRLVTILMVVGAITAAFGLVQQVMGPERLNAMGFPYNDTIRFAGSFMRSFSTFIQPFGFGFFLMVVILIGLPVSLEEPRRLRSQLFLIALPFLGLATLTTIVRGAWLGLAVGVVYLGAHRYRLLLLVLPLALVAVLFLPSEAAAPAFSGSSSAERADGWRQNLPLALERPLGGGIGTTGSAALAAARLSGADVETYQTDNYYIKLLLEFGLIGLWSFGLLLVGIFSETRRTSRRAPGPDGALLAGASACIVGIAAACLVATYFEIFPMDLLFWLFAGVAADLGSRPAPVVLPRSVEVLSEVAYVQQ